MRAQRSLNEEACEPSLRKRGDSSGLSGELIASSARSVARELHMNVQSTLRGQRSIESAQPCSKNSPDERCRFVQLATTLAVSNMRQ